MESFWEITKADDDSNGDPEDNNQKSSSNDDEKVAKHKARTRLRELLLSLLFRSRPKDQAIPEVIEVISEFPSLATGYYGHRWNFFTPLHCFLVCQATLYQVQGLLLASKYLKEQLLCLCDRDEDLPLHVACKYSSAEVVEYLIEEYPEALREINEAGCLPLHCALVSPGDDESTHRLSVDILKEILELYPESVAMNNKNDRCPLSLALANRCPHEVIQYMIEIYPENCTDLDIPVAAGSENLYINLERAELLAKLFPRLNSLRLDVTRWTSGALIFLLKELQRNQSISDLGYFALPAQLLRGNSDILLALEKFFKTNDTVKNVHLSICDEDHYHSNRMTSEGEDYLMDALEASANSNHDVLQLQRLLIKDMGILGSFLASDAPPKTLSFVNSRFSGEWTREASERMTTLASNHRIEKLTFGHCYMLDGCWAKLINNLTQFPLLRELNICPNSYEIILAGKGDGIPKDTSFTDSFIALLGKGKLEKLAVPGFMVELEKLCECLSSNNTLDTFASYLNSGHAENHIDSAACLDLLKHHNATITEFMPYSLEEKGPGEEKYPKIAYFCRLNKLGRARFRNPETPMEELITILLRVKGNECTILRGPSEELSMLYGLLREAPTVWSSSTSSTAAAGEKQHVGTSSVIRKRKCPAS